MGGRPRDWHPLADSDPIPGDPERLEQLGKELRKTADELDRQLGHIKSVVKVESWDSDAGKEFRGKVKESRGRLEAALKRYETVADAIGDSIIDYGAGYEANATASPRNYATDLNRAQKIADVALREARDAEERKGAAAKSIDQLTGKDEKKSKKELEEKRDAADGDVEAARTKLEEAKGIRDQAAKVARDAIDDVISSDSLKDGFWDEFGDVVSFIADLTENIAKWAGIASLLVGWIPVIGQALAGLLGAISMVATLVNVLCTAIQVVMGDASWTELGWAAVGFLAMGVGKAFSKVAGRFVKSAVKRMDLAGKAANTSKAARRQGKQFNKLANKKDTLEKGDVLKSLREVFTEPFTKAAWKDGFKALKTPSGYRDAKNTVTIRGEGSLPLGAARSFSLADAGVASQLKEIKGMSGALSQFPGANKIASKATVMSGVGSAITVGGLFIDEVSGGDD
ncbi:WXG100 family type VII secretion target [Streptomyces phaeochromogenes]|uniref:WXG100 family type VII secretion target n=1 Tax=Streptomyces phaeochromogenes TaxID=1923 RepID=UPI0033EC2D62